MISEEMEIILYKALGLESIPRKITPLDSQLPIDKHIGFADIEQNKTLIKENQNLKDHKRGGAKNLHSEHRSAPKIKLKQKRKKQNATKPGKTKKRTHIFGSLFKVLATKNPKSHGGFLGSIWPVKK